MSEAANVIGAEKVERIIRSIFPYGAPDNVTAKDAHRVGVAINRAAVKALHEEGLSNKRISAKLGISEWLVLRLLR